LRGDGGWAAGWLFWLAGHDFHLISATMRLPQGHHLAYCTNIHRGETWEEVFDALSTHALAVRDRVAGGAPFGLGLRLGLRLGLQVELQVGRQVVHAGLSSPALGTCIVGGVGYGTP
jgi:hypothetical protein